MCALNRDSQQDFIVNVLKADPHLKLFDLCDKSVDNTEDFVRTVLPLKLSRTVSFETLCDLTENSLDEALRNLFGFDKLKIHNIKNYCQSPKTTSPDALTSFFGRSTIDYQNICSENRKLGYEIWSMLQATFKLNDSHRIQLEMLCDFDESFYRLVMDSAFFVKFSGNSALKKLCFVNPDVRNQAVKEGYVSVKSIRGGKEKFELEMFDEICTFKPQKDDKIDQILSKYKSGSLTGLISTGSLCETALTLKSATISLLYDLDDSDAEQLLWLCETNQVAVDYWMRFLPQKAKIFKSFFDWCQLDVEFREELIGTKTLNGRVFDLMCGLDISKEDAGRFENEIFNYVPELLDDVFDRKKICLSKDETRKEIMEVVLGDANEYSCDLEELEATSNKRGKEIEDLSIAGSLCRLSSTSRYDFLKTSYNLTNMTINFLDETCAELNSFATIINNIQELDKLSYFDISEVCEANRKSSLNFPLFTGICRNSDFERQLTTLKKKIDKSNGLKSENLCVIDPKFLNFFFKSIRVHEKEIQEIQKICGEKRGNFMRESSGFVFSIEKLLNHLSFLEPMEVDGGLTSSFYDLGVKTIDQMQKFRNLKAELMEKRFQAVYNDDRIRPGYFCELDKENKVAALQEVVGGENQRINELEELCSFDRDLPMHLKHIAFHQNIAGNLQPFKLCAIDDESQNEILQKFFGLDNPSNINLPRLCQASDFKIESLANLVSQSAFNTLTPIDLCLMSRTSRDEIFQELLKIDNSKTFDEIDKFCQLEPKHQSKLFQIPPTVVDEVLPSHCSNRVLWKDIARNAFGHQNCVFLNVQDICPEVVLEQVKLKFSEIVEIQTQFHELIESYDLAINGSIEIFEIGQNILRLLNVYEESIEAFANFRTIPIAIFRSFTMFTGEFEGENFTQPLQMIMLLLFIFFMTITLQNLMNGIALIDAQEIINEAQIIGIKKRISLVYSYENLATTLFKNRATVFSTKIMNRFVLTPNKGRQLILFDPLKLYYSKTLKLSKESFESVVNFCDSKK
jgi:hypothetical protein